MAKYRAFSLHSLDTEHYENSAPVRRSFKPLQKVNFNFGVGQIDLSSGLYFTYLLLFVVLGIRSILNECGHYSADNLGQSWLIEKSLTDENWSSQYLKAFYYSTVTMFTVGYGDIVPQSQLETLCSICFMMICSI